MKISMNDLGADVLAAISGAAAGAVLLAKLHTAEVLGVGDGTLVDFSVPVTVDTLLGVYVDGIRQTQATDYTLPAAGTTVHFTTPPAAGELILADYYAK